MIASNRILWQNQASLHNAQKISFQNCSKDKVKPSKTTRMELGNLEGKGFLLQPSLVWFQSILVRLYSEYFPCFTTASSGLARWKGEKRRKFVGTGRETASSHGCATFANNSPTARPGGANPGTSKHAGERAGNHERNEWRRFHKDRISKVASQSRF